MQSPIRSVERSSKREQRLQRYLKPGALARLRDARIKASSRSHTTSLLPLPSARANPPMEEPVPAPCFAVVCFGPSFPQRKKLLASKAYFIHSTPSSPPPPAVGMVDALDPLPPPLDFLAVH
ncbi:hypothetical protein SUGI_0395770 [Cryptomeria japonica]|nr:hypothetical protein SUGI_0395770 [Cryptomeria japonica]